MDSLDDSEKVELEYPKVDKDRYYNLLPTIKTNTLLHYLLEMKNEERSVEIIKQLLEINIKIVNNEIHLITEGITLMHPQSI